jgi:hypothetical protein
VAIPKYLYPSVCLKKIWKDIALSNLCLKYIKKLINDTHVNSYSPKLTEMNKLHILNTEWFCVGTVIASSMYT